MANQWYATNAYCYGCDPPTRWPLGTIRCPECHQKIRQKKRGQNSPSLQKFKPSHVRNAQIVCRSQ